MEASINFTWFYYIGRNKLGLTFKEIGRMTLRTFNKLYKCYRDNFDLELSLKLNRMTYEEARQKTIQDEEWF